MYYQFSANEEKRKQLMDYWWLRWVAQGYFFGCYYMDPINTDWSE